MYSCYQRLSSWLTNEDIIARKLKLLWYLASILISLASGIHNGIELRSAVSGWKLSAFTTRAMLSWSSKNEPVADCLASKAVRQIVVKMADLALPWSSLMLTKWIDEKDHLGLRDDVWWKDGPGPGDCKQTGLIMNYTFNHLKWLPQSFPA